MQSSFVRLMWYTELLLLVGLMAAVYYISIPHSSASMPHYIASGATLVIALIFFARLCITLRSLNVEQKSELIESRRVLRQQQEALKRIAGNKALFSGDFARASRIISEIAAHTLGASKAIIWTLDESRSALVCFGAYQLDRSNIPKRAEMIESISLANYDLAQINEYRVMILEGAPEQDGSLLNSISNGSPSAMVAPFRRNADIQGFIAFASDSPARRWGPDAQSFAASIADFLSMAHEAEISKKFELELKRRSIALESTADGMAILDHREHFQFVNQSLLRMFGFKSAQHLLGKSWHVLYTKQEVQRIERIIKPLLRHKGKGRLEAIGRRCDNTFLSHELSLTAMESGGFVCTVTDGTERRLVEENLRRSQRFLDQVINANPNLIFVKDLHGRFTLVNQAVADMYGTTVSDLIGKKDSDFNEQSDEVDHFRKYDRMVIEEGRDVLVPEEIITDSRGKRHYLQTTKRPLRLGPGEPSQVLGVATDITERKRLEEQLLQAQKMEAIGQLAGGVAHDFNNYLTGIIGYTALLKSSSMNKGEVEHASDMIESIARKATQLTEKLLGFARKGKNQNIPVDLHSTITETLALLGRTIEKNISITQNLNAKRSFVVGDPMQMQQVVLNLAINARDAIAVLGGGVHPDGRISIVTRDSYVDPGSSQSAEGVKPGHYLMIEVQDNGCGIPPEIIEKVYEPFFTTKDPGKGTGMGLSMVYGIVKNHGGAIKVSSAPEQGSTFSIWLPSIERPMGLKVEKSSLGSIKGRGHILIVDDHQVIRDVTSRMLTSLGYDVVTARDGVEALRYYSENKFEIDLVILDMVMPNMGARECFREIKKINPHVRAILSTGYGNNHAVQEIMNEGMSGFVQKPYQLDKFSQVIAQVLQSPSALRTGEPGLGDTKSLTP
ncbi:MAG: PAS domain S-box protein [Deltaproteobacteria bacterium]|nr:PAS domain S-box protein [Deltaproteobacteria bacterium]